MGYTREQLIIEVAECYSEGLTYQETAEELGVPLSQIKRGMSRLKNDFPTLYAKATIIKEKHTKK